MTRKCQSETRCQVPVHPANGSVVHFEAVGRGTAVALSESVNLAAASDVGTNAVELLIPTTSGGPPQPASGFDFSCLLDMLLPNFEWSSPESPEPAMEDRNAGTAKGSDASSDGQLASLASLFSYVPVPSPILPPTADATGMPECGDGSDLGCMNAQQRMAEGTGAEDATEGMEAADSAPNRVRDVAFQARLLLRNDLAPELRVNSDLASADAAAAVLRESKPAKMSSPRASESATDLKPQPIFDAFADTRPIPIAEPKDAAPVAEGPAREVEAVVQPGRAAPIAGAEATTDSVPTQSWEGKTGAGQDQRQAPEQPRAVEPAKSGSQAGSESGRRKQERQPSLEIAPAARAPEPQAHALAHTPAPEGGRFAPRTSAPQQTPTPAEPQATPDPPRPQSQIQNLRLRVGTEDSAAVDLNVYQRGSTVQVSVRSADHSLNASLREHLPTLVENVQRAGYRVETSTPPGVEGERNLREQLSEIAQQGSAWQQDAEQKRQQQMYEDQPRKARPRATTEEQFEWQKILEVS